MGSGMIFMLCLLLYILDNYGVLPNARAASVQYAPAPFDADDLYLPINVPQPYPDPPPPPPIPIDIPGLEVPVMNHGPVLHNSTYGLLPYNKDQTEKMKIKFIVKPLFKKRAKDKKRLKKNRSGTARGKPTSGSQDISPRLYFSDEEETPRRKTIRNKAYVLVDTAQEPDDVTLYYIITRRRIYK